MHTETAIVEMKKIRKDFPGVKALKGVDFRLFPGEVHTIMGQNGAGKSTLVKVLTGVYKADGGEILLEGKPISPESPLAAQKLGINTLYQEINLCLNLSVAENICIGKEPRKLGRIDWPALNSRAEAALARLNIDVDVTENLSTCSIAVQQMTAIARVLNSEAKVLVFDEPTSSLDENEVEQLFSVVRKLRDEGMAILFITHFLNQTYQISDRITILKDGCFVGEYRAEKLPRLELITKMLGKELTVFSQRLGKKEGGAPEHLEEPGKAGGREASEPLLSAEALGLHGSINPFDLKVERGEVVGLAGLLGSGRSEAAKLLFGIDTPDEGTLFIQGRKKKLPSPKQAILEGIGFCSEDRKNEGIFDELSVRDNIIQALQVRQGVFHSIPRAKQQQIAEKLIEELGIKTPHAGYPVGKLSGGNQQKVILARWLATRPIVLILDEPTRGIDVGAKLEIMEQILNLSKTGMGIIFISSEFEEVIRCSDRIAVLRDREFIAELAGENLNEAKILHIIAGGK